VDEHKIFGILNIYFVWFFSLDEDILIILVVFVLIYASGFTGD